MARLGGKEVSQTLSGQVPGLRSLQNLETEKALIYWNRGYKRWACSHNGATGFGESPAEAYINMQFAHDPKSYVNRQ